MHYLRLLALCFSLFLFQPSFAVASTALEISAPTAAMPWPQVVELAKEYLPQEGELIAKPDGFVYLKVNDSYIHTLFPLLGLEEDGFTEPPYFRTKDAPGAHISVFYVNEHVKPEEVGQKFKFELKKIVIVQPEHDTRYAILEVDSPQLEGLRKKYGKTTKLKNHEFHISIGKQKLIR